MQNPQKDIYQAFAKHLIKEGISSKNLVAAGFGDSQPISNETNEESLAKNRRIEFKLDQR